MSAPLARLLVFDLSTLACLLDVVRCVVINLQSHPSCFIDGTLLSHVYSILVEAYISIIMHSHANVKVM